MPSEFKNLSDKVAKGSKEVSDNLRRMVDTAKKVDISQKRLTATQAKALKISDKYRKSVEKLRKESLKLRKENIKVASSFAAIGKTGTKTYLQTVINKVEELHGSMRNLTKSMKLVSPRIKIEVTGLTEAKKVKEDIGEIREETEGLKGEFQKTESEMGWMSRRFREGSEEAEDFAKGLGGVNGRLVAAGAGAIYLADKTAKLLKEFEAARMNLARYNVTTTLAGKTTRGFARDGLERLRKDLFLTREQASQYFKVVQEGTNVLGLSPAKIEAVSKALQKTFGGDPTDRLREYIDLLKEIPTLDVDLSISSSFDDQTAAVFALAQKGKIESVIDLQAAGLFGPGKPLEVEAKDVKMLNAQQKMLGATERINDTMLQFYPTWGSQFSAVVDYGAKAVGVAGAAVAGLGAMGFFLKKAHVGTMANLKVIQTQLANINSTLTMQGGGKLPGKLLKSIAPPKGAGKLAPVGAVPPKMLKSSIQAAKGMEKAGVATGRFALNIGKFAKIGTGVGIALMAAGVAADFLADHFEESGKDMAASATKGISGILETAGAALTGAAIGSLILPGLGTAIGAVVGGLAGLAMNLEKIGEPIEKLGKSMQESTMIAGQSIHRFGQIGQIVGRIYEVVGHTYVETGKYLKVFAKAAWEGAKTLWYWTSGVGYAIEGLKVFTTLLETPAYRRAYTEASKSADSLNKSMRGAVGASRRYERAQKQYFDGLMQSGLALQQEMELLKREFGSGKFALVEFVAGLASVRIDALSDAGGSAEAFSDAIGVSIGAVSKKFDLAGKAIERSRKRIMEDAKLQGEERRSALMALHKQELEAIKAFVDGMAQAIDALYRSPKIIQEGLKAQIAKTRIDVGLEIGGITAADFVEDSQKQIDALSGQLQESFKARQEQETRLAQLRNKLAATSETAVKSLGSETKKAFEAKGIIKETGKGIEFQKEATAKYYSELKGQIAATEAELDSLKESLPTKSFERLAVEMTQAKNEVNRYAKALEKANEELKDAGADPEKIKKAKENIDTVQKSFDEATRHQADAGREFKEFIGQMVKEVETSGKKKLDLEPFKKTLENVLKAVSEGKKLDTTGVVDSQKAVEEINRILGKTTDEMTKSAATFRQIRRAVEKLDEQAKMEGELAPIIDNIDGETKILEIQAKGVQKIAELQSAINAAQMMRTRILEVGEVKAMKLQLATLEEAQSRASLLGDPTKAVGDVMEQQAKLFSESLKELDRMLGIAKKEEEFGQELLSRRIKEREVAKKASDAGEEGSKERLKEAEENERNARISLSSTRNAIESYKKQSAELLNSIPKIGESLAKGVQEFREGLSGQEIEARIDLSDVLFEFAEFSSNVAASAKEAREIGVQASADRLKKEKQIIRALAAQEDKYIEKRVEAARASGAMPEVIARIKEEGEATKQAKIRTMEAKIETDHKRRVVDLAQKEADLKIQIVDATQSALEAEMEVASMRGYHLSVMVDKQKEILSYERMRVDALREQLENAKAAGADSHRIQLLSLQLRQAEANIQKKQLGYQRDIMERMLGAALGEIRTAVGARKRRLTDVGLMGVAATRVKTAGGAYTGAGPGGVKPYWQRLAEYKEAGKAGGAARLKPEQQMAKGLAETSGNTADTAKAVKNIDDRSEGPGSLYTHDVTTEGLLASLLYVAKEIAVGIAGMGLAAAPTKDGKDIRSELEKGLEGVRSEVEKRSKEASILAKAETGKSDKMEEVQRKEIAIQKKQFKQEKFTGKDVKISTKTARENLQNAQQELEAAKSTQDSKATIAKKEEAVLMAQSDLKNAIERESGKSQKKQDTTQVETVSALERVRRAQEAADVSGLGRPSKVKTIGQTFAAFRAGDRGLAAPGGIKKMGGATGAGLGGKMGGVATVGFGNEKKQIAKTMGDAVASVVETPPMTGVETAKIAEATRSFEPAGGGAGAFAAKPGLAAGGTAGGAAETSSMKVEGKMTVHFDHPAFKSEVTKVVVEIIRTPDVLKGLQKAGVPFM